MSAPRYQSCKYSLFVSYAHVDDSAYADWVKTLKDVIFKRLALASVPTLLGVHFSGQDGVVSGDLGFELEDRLAQSFAMLLVVGPKYVRSGWCRKELEMFRKVFGNQHRGRLYIAAMTESALNAAQGDSTWESIIGKHQARIEMFDPDNRARPLAHRMQDGSSGCPQSFLDRAWGIGDRLVEEIQRDVDAVESAPQVDTVVDKPPVSPWSEPVAGGLKIAIGPCTHALDVQTAALAEVLKAGGDVVQLERDLLTSYNPRTGKPLRQALAASDVLVVPVSDETPLLSGEDGGHIALLQREWSALGKMRDVVWFKPPAPTAVPASIDGMAGGASAARGSVVAAVDIAIDIGVGTATDADADPEAEIEDEVEDRHLAVIAQLAPVCNSPTAVAKLLFGGDKAIRIGIQRHKLGGFTSLANELIAAWERLRRSSNRPDLKCVPLQLGDLACGFEPPPDLAAVVLLFFGEKTPRSSLRYQEESVEHLVPKREGAYPGLVAAFVKPPPLPPPPPLDPVPEHDWLTVRFVRQNEDDAPSIDDENRNELNDFLNVLWRRHLQKTAPTVH